jgi:site-specific recombinase XerD
MRKLSPPEVPEVPVEPIAEDEMRALIKVCQRSRDFAHKRDEAIIRLIYDTGIRRKELANLREEDINRDLGVVLSWGRDDAPAPRRSTSRPP